MRKPFLNIPVVQGDEVLKAWHNLLLELFGFRVSPESLSPAFSCGKMDEVYLTINSNDVDTCIQISHPALIFQYGQSLFAHTQLARILQASSSSA